MRAVEELQNWGVRWSLMMAGGEQFPGEVGMQTRQ